MVRSFTCYTSCGQMLHIRHASSTADLKAAVAQTGDQPIKHALCTWMNKYWQESMLVVQFLFSLRGSPPVFLKEAKFLRWMDRTKMVAEQCWRNHKLVQPHPNTKAHSIKLCLCPAKRRQRKWHSEDPGRRSFQVQDNKGNGNNDQNIGRNSCSRTWLGDGTPWLTIPKE